MILIETKTGRKNTHWSDVDSYFGFHASKVDLIDYDYANYVNNASINGRGRKKIL